MSEATKAAVEEAIRAHIADEADEALVVTDWYVVAAAIGAVPDQTHYYRIVSNAPWHVLVGLVHWAWKRMSSWEDDEDE